MKGEILMSEKREYRIFRVFCVTSIVMLASLLTLTGILTAKYQTEKNAFDKNYDIVQVYEKEDSAVININGKISEIHPQRAGKYFNLLSHTVLAPADNIIEAVRAIIDYTGSIK